MLSEIHLISESQKKSVSEELVTVGKIGSSHGVRGWMRLYSFTDPPQKVLEYAPWFLSQQGFVFSVNLIEWRPKSKNLLLIQLKECTVKEKVIEFTNAELQVPKKNFPLLEEGEYYWSDLIGCTVKNLQSIILGTVDKILENPAQDILSVRGQASYLIPFINDVFIHSVNVQEREIIVDWSESFQSQ